MEKRWLWNWLPSLLIMAVIFWFSSRSSTELPNFQWADRLVKKSGHMVGYALLAICNWHGLERRRDKRWLAWLLSVAFAVTDEYHQSFVPGRQPSVWDVAIFDNLGALLGLWLGKRLEGFIPRQSPQREDGK